jgi:hypothetical protein
MLGNIAINGNNMDILREFIQTYFGREKQTPT